MLNSECRIPTRIDNELSNFLGDGGVLCIFVSKKNAALLKNYIDINTKTEGFKILPIDSKHWLWKIIKKGKYGFQWLAILKIGIYLSSSLALRRMADTFAKMYGKEDEFSDIQYYEEIAITPNRKCVSLIASVFEGKIIAIPFPCNAIEDLLRDILDGIKLNIIESKSKDVVAPKWIDEIRIPNETKALGSKINIIRSIDLLDNKKRPRGSIPFNRKMNPTAMNPNITKIIRIINACLPTIEVIRF